MFCPNCGSSVGDNSKFCGVCGYKLWGSDELAAPEENTPVPAPQEAVPVAENSPEASVNTETSQPAEQGSNVLPADQNLFSAPANDAPQEIWTADMPYQNTAPSGSIPAQGGFSAAGMNVPPMQPQYQQPAESYSVPVRKQVRKMHIAVSIVLAVVFGMLAYSTGLSAFTGAAVRMGLSSHSISEQMRKVDIGNIVIGDMLSQETMQDIVGNNCIKLPEKRAHKATLADIVALAFDKVYEPLTADQVKKILEKSRAADKLADLVACYEDYILTDRYDDFEDGICEEIKDIVKKTETSVTEITHLRLADDYEAQLDKMLDENYDVIEGILPDNSIGSSAQSLSITLAPASLIVYLVLSLAFIALPGIITKRLGVSLMTGGVVFSVLGLGMTAVSIFISCLGALPGLNVSIIKDILVPMVYNAFGVNFLIGGLVSLGVGLVLIAVFIVLKVLAKKKSLKRTANA